jgi:hypothetical protein
MTKTTALTRPKGGGAIRVIVFQKGEELLSPACPELGE